MSEQNKQIARRRFLEFTGKSMIIAGLGAILTISNKFVSPVEADGCCYCVCECVANCPTDCCNCTCDTYICYCEEYCACDPIDCPCEYDCPCQSY